MRVEVKDDDFKREFLAKHSKFEKCWAFNKFKNRKKTFEDLYSKEFAKYKDNLKTNTFINLKYVLNEDNMLKYPEGIKSIKNKENDIIHRKGMKESTAEQPDYFMLKSEQKSKESSIGDTEITSITSKVAANFKSSNATNSTNNSNVSKISSSFGDVTKNYMKNEIYHSIPASPKTDNLIKASENNEVFKPDEFSSPQCQIRQLSSESSMLLNSLDILKNNQEKASDVYIDLEPVPHNSQKPANYEEKLNEKNEITCGAKNETNDSDLKKVSSFKSFEGTTKDDMNCEIYHDVSTLPKIDDTDTMKSPSDDETFKLTEHSSMRFQIRHSSSESFMSFDSLDLPKTNQEKASDVYVNLESVPHNNDSNFEKISANLEDMTKNDTNKTVYNNVLTFPKVDVTIGLSSDSKILKKSERSDTSLEVFKLLSDLVMSLESLEIPKNNQDQVNYTESKSTSHDGEKFVDNNKKLDSKTEQLCGAVNTINDLNLEKISRNYGNMIKGDIDDIIYHNVSAFPKIGNTTESVLNDETFKQSGYSGTSFEIYSLLSDSGSLDSLEIPTIDQKITCDKYTELKSASYEGEKFDNNDVKLDTKIGELWRSENGTSPCRKVVHVNSVFNIKSALEQNVVNKSKSCQSFENRRTYTYENEKLKDDVSKIISQNNRSDDAMSYTNNCIVKDDTDDLHFSASVKDDTNDLNFGASVRDNNVDLHFATSVKDNNADLHFATSVKEVTEKSGRCYENKEKSISEILIPKVNVMEMQIDFQNNISDEEMNIKEELEEERGTLNTEFYFQNDENDDIKTEANLFSFAEHLKKNETDTISINSFKNKKKTKYTFHLRRNYSYDKAIKNGRSDLKRNENFTATKRNKLNTGKRASFLKFPFMNKNSSTTKKKANVDSKVQLKKSKPNASTLINQDNNQDSQNRSSVMKECVSGDSETSPEENTRGRRRKWLKYFLCIGSK